METKNSKTAKTSNVGKETTKVEATPSKLNSKLNRQVGDLHENGLWVWAASKTGNLDWRVRPEMKQKVGAKPAPMTLEKFAKKDIWNELEGSIGHSEFGPKSKEILIDFGKVTDLNKSLSTLQAKYANDLVFERKDDASRKRIYTLSVKDKK